MCVFSASYFLKKTARKGSDMPSVLGSRVGKKKCVSFPLLQLKKKKCVAVAYDTSRLSITFVCVCFLLI